MIFITLTTASRTAIHLNPAHIVGFTRTTGSSSSNTKVTLTSLDGRGANHVEYVVEMPDEIRQMLIACEP